MSRRVVGLMSRYRHHAVASFWVRVSEDSHGTMGVRFKPPDINARDANSTLSSSELEPERFGSLDFFVWHADCTAGVVTSD
jgi:hypothetical protein